MKLNRIIPVLMILAVFFGFSTVSATPTTNQTIATSFDVQNYIGIDTNASSVYFGNVTPGSNPSSLLTLSDYSNVNIDVWGVMYADFTGPQALDSNLIKGNVTGGSQYTFTTSVPGKLFGNWTATGSTQTKGYTLTLSLPYGSLPGHYNSTVYTYAQTAS